MGHLGEYQSLFQLAAALSIGILALETVLDSPVTKKKPEFQLLLIQVKTYFLEDRGPNDGAVAPKLASLSKEIQDKIDTDLLADRIKNDWPIIAMRLFGICFAIASVAFLLHASESYSKPRVPSDFWIAISLLLVPVLLTIVLLFISDRILQRFEQERTNLEGRFLALVDEAWGLSNSDQTSREHVGP